MGPTDGPGRAVDRDCADEAVFSHGTGATRPIGTANPFVSLE